MIPLLANIKAILKVGYLKQNKRIEIDLTTFKKDEVKIVKIWSWTKFKNIPFAVFWNNKNEVGFAEMQNK